MSQLLVEGLRARVGGKDVLRGVDLEVSSGKVHAVMGPNGSGKSTLAHVLMGRPGYEVTGGRVTLDGTDLLGLAPYERAAAGLFLVLQYPTEVPGVTVEAMLAEALPAVGADADDVGGRLREEARRIGVDERFLGRGLNVDLSGGEKKRNEILQLGMLRPRIAVLDEVDSGLDVDALRAVSRRVEEETEERGLGVLAITHYRRLLSVLRADVVHVLVKGRVVATGGPELADELERTGYGAYGGEDEEPTADHLEEAIDAGLDAGGEERVVLEEGGAMSESWDEVDGKLHRELTFADFAEAFAFMQRVAAVAEELDHHPDWSNSWNRVTIDLVSHSAGGITDKDRELARRIDELL